MARGLPSDDIAAIARYYAAQPASPAISRAIGDRVGRQVPLPARQSLLGHSGLQGLPRRDGARHRAAAAACGAARDLPGAAAEGIHPAKAHQRQRGDVRRGGEAHGAGDEGGGGVPLHAALRGPSGTSSSCPCRRRRASPPLLRRASAGRRAGLQGADGKGRALLAAGDDRDRADGHGTSFGSSRLYHRRALALRPRRERRRSRPARRLRAAPGRSAPRAPSRCAPRSPGRDPRPTFRCAPRRGA